MRKIRDVLRLHLKGGLSQRQIAAALGISKGVVAKYISLATQLGLSWDDISQLSETALERRLIPPAHPPEYFVRPDFGHLHHEMRRKGMTIMLLWQDFARHYGCSILPARPRHPQDKAKVESAVQVVERWILMRLRHQRFDTVDEVNAAIAPLLEYLNT